MKLSILFASCAFIAAVGVASTASAHDDEFKNLKVLKVTKLEKAMKKITKGLGVKCKTCHVKGKWDKDDVAAKAKARDFFKAVVGEADQGKKEAALKTLLGELKLEAAKKPEKLWKGISMLEKQ